jgi:hypothetical protein
MHSLTVRRLTPGALKWIGKRTKDSKNLQGRKIQAVVPFNTTAGKLPIAWRASGC